MKGVFINDYIKDKETRVMEKSITLYFIMKGSYKMNKTDVIFHIRDNYTKNPGIYKDISIEPIQFENSMFSKIELTGSKLYGCRYMMSIYGIKMFKNSNIPITKELEDFICSIVNNSKFVKENNIKAYKLFINVRNNRGVINIDDYIKDNYNVSIYPISFVRLKSNKEFIVGDD